MKWLSMMCDGKRSSAKVEASGQATEEAVIEGLLLLEVLQQHMQQVDIYSVKYFRVIPP